MGVNAELFHSPLAACGTEGLASGRIREQNQEGLRQGAGIPRGNQETRDPIHDDLRSPPGRRCHKGFGHRHGFKENPTAGFRISRQDTDVPSS